MALETFLTALYVIVDDLYQSHIQPQMPVSGGPPAQMSESEVLCLGLAAQWRSGVPWKSERGMLRYVRNHLRYLFPTVLSQSAFNRRLRRLWVSSPTRRAWTRNRPTLPTRACSTPINSGSTCRSAPKTFVPLPSASRGSCKNDGDGRMGHVLHIMLADSCHAMVAYSVYSIQGVHHS